MASASLVVGTRVTITGKEQLGVGILRFIGETKFRPGVWAGVELSKPEGKNNGTVQKVKYFTCKDNHGIFIPAQSIVAVPRSSAAGSKRASTSASRSTTPARAVAKSPAPSRASPAAASKASAAQAAVAAEKAAAEKAAAQKAAAKKAAEKAASDEAAAKQAAADEAAAMQAASKAEAARAAAQRAAAEKATAEKAAADKAAAEKAAEKAAAEKAAAEKAATEKQAAEKAAADQAAADQAAAKKAAAAAEQAAAAQKAAAAQQAAAVERAAAAERAAIEKAAAAEQAATERRAAEDAARAAASAEASAEVDRARSAAEQEKAEAERAKSAAAAAAAAAEEEQAAAVRLAEEADSEKAAAAQAKAAAAQAAKAAEAETAAAQRAKAEAAQRAAEAMKEKEDAAKRAAAAEKEKAAAERATTAAAEQAAAAEKLKLAAEAKAAASAKEKAEAESANAKAQKAKRVAEAKAAASAEEKAAAEKAQATALKLQKAAEARAASIEQEKVAAERLHAEAQKARKAAEARALAEAKDRAEAEAAASRAEQALEQQKIAMADFQTSSKALKLEVEQLRAECEELRAAKSTTADSAKEKISSLIRARKEAEEKAETQAKQVAALKKDTEKQRTAYEKEAEKTAAAHKKEMTQLKDKLEDLELTMEDMKLDVEMAEEATATAEQECEQLKGQLEIALAQAPARSVVEGDDSEATEATPSEAQLKENNDRLTTALMKLRDLSIAEKQERDKKIKELERENSQLPKLEEKVLQLETECLQAEENVEELKEQLDAALEATDVLDELTEKNMDLEDSVKELKQTIEDLEEMRDLSEELESQQAETEKQLRKEVLLMEVKLQDQETVIGNVVAKIKDQEETILKYRAKVDELKAKLFKYTASEQEKSVEADSLEAKANRLLEENISMRSQLDKLCGAEMDRELGEMELNSAKWQLAQLSSFVPSSVIEVEREGVDCQYLLHRLVDKSSFVSEKIKQEHHIHDFIIATVSDRTVDDRYSGYKVFNRAFATASISTDQKQLARLVDALHHSASQLLRSMETATEEESWANMRKMQWDLSGHERTLDRIIEALKAKEITSSFDTKPLEDAIAAIKNVGQRYGALPVAFSCTSSLQAVAYGCQFLILEHQLMQRTIAHNLAVDDSTSAVATVAELCQTSAFRAAVKGVLDEAKTAFRALNRPEVDVFNGEELSDLVTSYSACRNDCAEVLRAINLVSSEISSAVSDLDSQARSQEEMTTLLATALHRAFPAAEGEEVPTQEGATPWAKPIAELVSLGSSATALSETAAIISSNAVDAAVCDSVPALHARAAAIKGELDSLNILKAQLDEKRAVIEGQASKVIAQENDLAEGQRARTLLEGRISSLLSREEELQRVVSEKDAEITKQAKTWEDALVSLQEDLDTAEAENRELADKLAQGRKPGSSKRGLTTTASGTNLSVHVGTTGAMPTELLAAMEFLRKENRLLRSQAAAAGARRLSLAPLPGKAQEEPALVKCRQQLHRLRQVTMAVRACPVVVDLTAAGEQAAMSRSAEVALLRADAAKLRIAVQRALSYSHQEEGTPSFAEAPEVNLAKPSTRMVGRLRLPASRMTKIGSVCSLALDPSDLHLIHSQLA